MTKALLFNIMLTQRLSQHGVITDLTQVSPSDVAIMGQRKEQAKQQAQYAVAYARNVKSVLKSVARISKTQADLYKSAHDELKEADRNRLDQYKAELAHQVHMARVDVQRQGLDMRYQAESASAIEIERAKAQGQLIAIGLKHRRALQAAQPKRQGLLGFLRNGTR